MCEILSKDFRCSWEMDIEILRSSSRTWRFWILIWVITDKLCVPNLVSWWLLILEEVKKCKIEYGRCISISKSFLKHKCGIIDTCDFRLQACEMQEFERANETLFSVWKWTICFWSRSKVIVKSDWSSERNLNPWSVNRTKWLNTLKQFASAVADELFECVWPFCGVGS